MKLKKKFDKNNAGKSVVRSRTVFEINILLQPAGRRIKRPDATREGRFLPEKNFGARFLPQLGIYQARLTSHFKVCLMFYPTVCNTLSYKLSKVPFRAVEVCDSVQTSKRRCAAKTQTGVKKNFSS